MAKSELSWIQVKDIEKSKDFFLNTLGLSLHEEQKEFGWVELGGEKGGLLGLASIKNDQELEFGKNAIITITVDDLNSIKEKLIEFGIEFIGEIHEIPGLLKMALFEDPSHNRFQLVEKFEKEIRKPLPSSKDSLVKGTFLSWIQVHDLIKAKKMFVDIIGLTLLEENENYGWLELGSVHGEPIIGISSVNQDKEECSQVEFNPGDNAIVSLTVDDTEEVKKKLENMGVSFVGEIIEIPGELKIANFLDLDNNRFQIVEKI
ncbi:MAG: VOC family protein [Simkaniaceae bacterium]